MYSLVQSDLVRVTFAAFCLRRLAHNYFGMYGLLFVRARYNLIISE